MKVKISNSTDEVEVVQFRPMEKGYLKAFFTLVVHPRGQVIRKCRYFDKNGNRWFSFPQEEIKKKDGSKSDYFSLVDYLDKDYLNQLKEATLTALKDAKPEAPNGKAQYQSNQRKENNVQADTSFDEELPF